MDIVCRICTHCIKSEDSLSMSPCGHLFHTDCLITKPSTLPDAQGRHQPEPQLQSQRPRWPKCPVCSVDFTSPAIQFRAVYLNWNDTGVAAERDIGYVRMKLNPLLKHVRDIQMAENQQLRAMLARASVDEFHVSHAEESLRQKNVALDENLEQIKSTNNELRSKLQWYDSEEQMRQQRLDIRERMDELQDLQQVIRDAAPDVAATMRSGQSRRQLELTVLKTKQQIPLSQQAHEMETKQVHAIEQRIEATQLENQIVLEPKVRQCQARLAYCTRRRATINANATVSSPIVQPVPNASSPFVVRQQNVNRRSMMTAGSFGSNCSPIRSRKVLASNVASGSLAMGTSKENNVLPVIKDEERRQLHRRRTAPVAARR